MPRSTCVAKIWIPERGTHLTRINGMPPPEVTENDIASDQPLRNQIDLDAPALLSACQAMGRQVNFPYGYALTSLPFFQWLLDVGSAAGIHETCALGLGAGYESATHHRGFDGAVHTSDFVLKVFTWAGKPCSDPCAFLWFGRQRGILTPSGADFRPPR